MSAHRIVPGAGAAGLAILLAGALSAQQPLDRNIPPTPGRPPELQVPKWTHTVLANGAELIVSEKHDLPLVAFSISFVGGAANYEPAAKAGLAGFTAQMLSEGTTSRTGDQLSDAQQMLGTSIQAGIGSEEGSIGFTALKDRFPQALGLLTDMMLHPSFPAASLERIRAQRLVSLKQAKESPASIAGNVFGRVLYGAEHPYGRITTEASVSAITRDDIVNFHRDYYRPGRAIITVVGDVDPAAVKGMVEKALAAWPAGGTRPTFRYPPVPPQARTTIYLVDKPQAAQSIFALGGPGPARATPDYYAIEMMNTILGRLFQSRLNHDIREVKGYSYGVSSSFDYGHGPGAFQAGGAIVTSKTDSALIEFMKQLKGVQGSEPFTDDEMSQGRAALIQSLPSRFASVNGIAGSIAELYTDRLPATFYQDFARHVNAVTKAQMVAAARKYIDLDHLNIIIVGDRSTIEAPLRQTGIAPIVILDREGKRAQ